MPLHRTFSRHLGTLFNGHLGTLFKIDNNQVNAYTRYLGTLFKIDNNQVNAYTQQLTLYTLFFYKIQLFIISAVYSVKYTQKKQFECSYPLFSEIF